MTKTDFCIVDFLAEACDLSQCRANKLIRAVPWALSWVLAKNTKGMVSTAFYSRLTKEQLSLGGTIGTRGWFLGKSWNQVSPLWRGPGNSRVNPYQRITFWTENCWSLGFRGPLGRKNPNQICARSRGKGATKGFGFPGRNPFSPWDWKGRVLGPISAGKRGNGLAKTGSSRGWNPGENGPQIGQFPG